MDNIVSTLLSMSFSASFLIVAVLLLRMLFKRAPKWINCLLWLFVALRLAVPFSLESPLSLIPSRQTLESVNQTSPVYFDYSNLHIESASDTVSTANIFFLIWVLGTAAMLLYMMISYFALKRRVSEKIKLRDNIWLCDRIKTPFIFGIIRPQIYLPTNLSESEKEYVIAHELAHKKRGDNIWKPLGYLILSVHWFNPLCWLAFWLCTKDIELACDERVIKNYDAANKRRYSSALLSCSVEKHMLSACPFSLDESGLKNRIKSVLNYKKPALWIIIAALVICTATAVLFLTSPESQPTKAVSKNETSAVSDTTVPKTSAEPATTVPATTEPVTTEPPTTQPPTTQPVTTEPKETSEISETPEDSYNDYNSYENYNEDSYYEDSYNDSYYEEDEPVGIVEIQEFPGIDPDKYTFPPMEIYGQSYSEKKPSNDMSEYQDVLRWDLS